MKRAVGTEIAQRSGRSKLTSDFLALVGVLEQIVVRAMLGGVIVDRDRVVLDGNLDGQLDRMRRRLANH